MLDEKRQAAIYCRVASADEFALENQRLKMRRFAASKGFDVTVEYLDNGESGLTFDRPAFSEMNADITAGKIHTVLVMSASRIGRESFAVAKWLDKVRKLGVDVVSEHDDIETCELLFSVFHGIMNRK